MIKRWEIVKLYRCPYCGEDYADQPRHCPECTLRVGKATNDSTAILDWVKKNDVGYYKGYYCIEENAFKKAMRDL